MGAWGTGSFENDDALDWLSNDFEGSEDLSAIADAVAAVAGWEEDEYLELPECGAAVAAAEIIAELRGRPADDIPDDVKEWVRAHSVEVPSHVVEDALRALDRILRDSEMSGGWNTPELEQQWRAGIADLQRRVEG